MQKYTSLRSLFVIVFLAMAFLGYSQNNTVIGNLKDTLNKTNLANASISLLRANDSVLVKYTRSNNNGKFSFSNVAKGKYVLMITYPKFTDFFDDIVIEEDKVNDLKSIALVSRVALLQEVIINGKVAAIRFKGDTLEFKADSFKTGANANVQDLLKKMPGITVNSKGEIAALGVKVEKVLVDGEEFFSDDPAVVTKNLRADAIDKVQVFDKKSDQATFTGIDDGEKTRTVNLQMKEDKKKGYFGKVEAGSDFDRYRYGKAMANAFRGKKKMAAYITNDNTSYESLNWNERTNYGEDLNRTTQVNDDGGVSIWSNGDDFSWGQGLPTSTTAGLHYSQKWNSDKHNSINTYQHNNLNVTGINTSTTQTLLSDSNFFVNKTNQNFSNNKQRNRLRTTYEWTIDSTSTLKIVATGSSINTKTSNNYFGSTSNSKNVLLNQTNRNTMTNEDERTLVGNINWRKRFKKKGRTISFNADFDVTDKDNTINLLATNQFFTGTPYTQQIDQFKTNNENRFNIRTRTSYTEPLWKNTFLEANYRFENSKNNAERLTFDKGTDGKYSVLVDSLSNYFKFNNTSNIGGLNFKYANKKVSASIGTSIANVEFAMQDIRKNNSRSVTFTNWLPQANIAFTPKKQTRLNFSYNVRNRNPSLMQIQPFLDNIDPLNLTIGNPSLKQEFTHSFNFTYSQYKVLKSKNLYFNANYSFTNNAITNSNTVDKTTGQNINQAINVNGNYNFNIWANYGLDILPSINVNFQFNPRVSKFVNVVNGVLNENKSANYSLDIHSGYWGDKWINYWFGFGPTYNTSSSTINPIETKFWSFRSNYSIEMKLKNKWYINVDGETNIYQKTAVFANQQDFWRINCYIKKSLDKAENWQLQLGVHDILNQNQNINRNISSNFISESTRQVIQRYGMLSITYNFSKNGKPSQGW